VVSRFESCKTHAFDKAGVRDVDVGWRLRIVYILSTMYDTMTGYNADTYIAESMLGLC
jgi:hypothetical protein